MFAMSKLSGTGVSDTATLPYLLCCPLVALVVDMWCFGSKNLEPVVIKQVVIVHAMVAS